MSRKLLFPLVLGIAGTAILLWLGTWQLQRLQWKEAILADIQARITASPVAIPARPDPEADRYLPVAAEGTIGDREILVQSSLKGVGPGFRVIAPFDTGARRILIDRGFLRAGDRSAPRNGGPASLTGNLYWPDELDGFTPEPDREEGLWFARDLPSLADELNAEPVLMVVRSADPPAAGAVPLPVSSAGLPNDHLQYAVTWFLLAVVWLGMSLYLLVRTHRGTA